jgi:hypothetical protein
MAVRVLQVIAVTLWIVGSIAGVAYAGGPFWAAALLCVPAVWWTFTWRDLTYRAPAIPAGVTRMREAEWQARIEARVAELRAGPAHRRKYIQTAERFGILYSDEQIDYMEDAGRLVCCEHLRPVEAAHRARGVRMEWPGKGLVVTGLQLRRGMELPEHVVMEDVPGPDERGPTLLGLRCTLCGDRMEEAYWAQSEAGSP